MLDAGRGRLGVVAEVRPQPLHEELASDAVIVGTDRVAANGDVANKIGTYQLAVLAKENDIPFYPVVPTSTIDLSLANGDLIPIEDIERIEILPGTATAFGRNALGGVINITTKRGRTEAPHFGVSLGGGSFGRQKYGFSADGLLPFWNLDYYFGVSRELTDGFRDASGGRITRLAGKLGYRLGDNTDVTLSYTHVLDHLKQAGSLPDSTLHFDGGRTCGLHFDRDGNCTPGDFSSSNLNLVALNVRQKLPMGFSLAVSGMMIPPLLFSSSSTRFTITRS